jgi:hypothetical protein
MKDPAPPSDQKSPPPSDSFRALVAKIVQTPKAEVDKREKAYQKERKKHPKPGPKPLQ